MLGASPKHLIGLVFHELLAGESRSALEEILGRLETGRKPDIRMLRLRRREKLLLVSAAGFSSAETPGRYFLTLAETREALPVAAPEGDEVDPRSGLLTSDAFARRAASLVAANDQDTDMIMVQVPGLGTLSESIGEVASQQVVRRIGAILAGAAKDGETAFFQEGNQFGVLHDHRVTPQSLQATLSEALRNSGPGGKQLSVLATALHIDIGDRSPADIARALGYALSRFAISGERNQPIQRLSDALNALMTETITRIDMLRDVFSRRHFQLVYQPIVDLRTRRIHHQEALTRMADGGSPFEDVTFAEEVGLINDLDFAVCCRVMDTLDDNPDACDIALNLSGRSLESDVFCAQLILFLRTNGRAASRLLIEVTESARIADMDKVGRVLADLRALGQRIYIDDFGSGSAGLHYLKAFDADSVKIDGSLVRNLHTNAKSLALVECITHLSKNLGMTTVAEMIEQEAEMTELLRVGVDYGQGYLFSKPRKQLFRTGMVVERQGAARVDPPRLDPPRRRGMRTVWE